MVLSQFIIFVCIMYELTFSEKDREKVMDSYLPHVLSTYRAIKKKRKARKVIAMDIYTWIPRDRYWEASPLNHPSTFDTLAIEPELKKAIVDDLDRFLPRKDFYKKVGKRWNRPGLFIIRPFWNWEIQPHRCYCKLLQLNLMSTFWSSPILTLTMNC
jgi:hypothetical protein